MIRSASIIAVLLCLGASSPPPLPVAKTPAKVSAAALTTKGAGAKALLAKPKAVVPPAKNVKVSWTYPIGVTDTVTFTSWDTKSQNRITNSVVFTNMIDVQAKSPASSWLTVATTNKPPVVLPATNSITFYRLKSYWKS